MHEMHFFLHLLVVSCRIYHEVNSKERTRADIRTSLGEKSIELFQSTSSVPDLNVVIKGNLIYANKQDSLAEFISQPRSNGPCFVLSL